MYTYYNILVYITTYRRQRVINHDTEKDALFHENDTHFVQWSFHNPVAHAYCGTKYLMSCSLLSAHPIVADGKHVKPIKKKKKVKRARKVIEFSGIEHTERSL